ncbi:MAG TPA: hypothetical protein VKC60_13160 [Opitutaceae bacterium]|nr:hypothetical protein [Opitutaceae bacterium]
MNTPTIYHRTVHSVRTLSSSNHITIRIRAERHWHSLEPLNKKLRLVVEVEGKVFENSRTDEIKWEIVWLPNELPNLEAAVDRILFLGTQDENLADPESEVFSPVHQAATVGFTNFAGSRLGYIDFRRENRTIRATFADLEALNDFKNNLSSAARIKDEGTKAA